MARMKACFNKLAVFLLLAPAILAYGEDNSVDTTNREGKICKSYLNLILNDPKHNLFASKSE